MKLHSEGKKIVPVAAMSLLILNIILYLFLGSYPVFKLIVTASIVFLGMITWFFRVPVRLVHRNPTSVLAPADGDVVEIIQTTEKEYFGDERIQVSIFMSIFNVHINRIPVEGEIIYQKHIDGKFLPAFIKRSSEENERCTTVIRTPDGHEVLVRQIAGAVARRIRTFRKPGDRVNQEQELGFIRFGSRVDVFLPLSSKIEVVHHQKSVGGQTVIATF